MKIGIVISWYHREVAEGLLDGALQIFDEETIDFDPKKDLFVAPGAFEIPLVAQNVVRLEHYAGVVCLGCLIRGETMYFDCICTEVARALMALGMAVNKPIAFGVLTVLTMEQAQARSQLDELGNKGREAAQACVDTLRTIEFLNEIDQAES